MLLRRSSLLLWLLVAVVCGGVRADDGKVIRVGIVGCDTSHATAFTKLLNDPKAEGELAGVEVVAAFPEVSEDIESSYGRIEGYTEALREMGVEIVDSMDALLERVDAVLIESVDGRAHLRQASAVIAAGKPMFIDKPMAASLADGLAIFRLAKEAGVPCFSSSSLRFATGTLGARENPKLGGVVGADTYSPCTLDPTHPDLFWYGIHGVESLFTIMGPGCRSVTRVHTADTDVVTGVWADGRVGVFRGLRSGKRGYGGMVYGNKAVLPADGYDGYEPLVRAIAEFFKTGQSPVDPQETIEILAFMEAADESKRLGGVPVTIESIMARAKSAGQ